MMAGHMPATFALPGDARGVLPAQHLAAACAAGVIVAPAPPDEQTLQPASLDLSLGPVAYRLRSSFLPETEPVRSKLADLSMGELDLTGGAVLEQNRPYLIPLRERLALPEGLAAKANPKSSTGRLDLFTRVITDRSHKFDEIAPGYTGELYLEVVSRSFTVKVHTGLSLNQLRLTAGQATCSDDDIRAIHRDTAPLLWVGDQPVADEELSVGRGLFLSLDLSGTGADRVVGYRAKKNSELLDLSRVGAYEAEDFWEPVTADRLKQRIVLEPEEFYLLLSREGVCIPPDLAAEMTAYDPTNGELRTHYAGFFDPGFGWRDDGLPGGSRAALEVRAHDVPFMVEHGQRVCTLTFERMLARPEVLYGRSSHYQFQTQALSKHFRR